MLDTIRTLCTLKAPDFFRGLGMALSATRVGLGDRPAGQLHEGRILHLGTSRFLAASDGLLRVLPDGWFLVAFLRGRRPAGP
jgi:hypothetical protein